MDLNEEEIREMCRELFLESELIIFCSTNNFIANQTFLLEGCVDFTKVG